MALGHFGLESSLSRVVSIRSRCRQSGASVPVYFGSLVVSIKSHFGTGSFLTSRQCVQLLSSHINMYNGASIER